MPDVIIWMLRREKRVAFARIPAHQVLYSSYNEQACGQHCGKTQTVFLQVPYKIIVIVFFHHRSPEEVIFVHICSFFSH